MDVVNAKVVRPRYSYRGTPLAVGTIVRMAAAMFQETQQSQPSNFARASDDDVKRAKLIVDLVEVKPSNVIDPETGERPKFDADDSARNTAG